jgi:hypothetical protein
MINGVTASIAADKADNIAKNTEATALPINLKSTLRIHSLLWLLKTQIAAFGSRAFRSTNWFLQIGGTAFSGRFSLPK